MSNTPDTSQSADPRFPIGKFYPPPTVTPEVLAGAIAELAELPSQLRNAVEDLDNDQLDTPYRKDGWTVRQLVHHIADSHMNAYMRVKLALSEDLPTIRPYDQKKWAEMHDSVAPAEWSLELVESLHARWVMLLQSLNGEQWQRAYVHPERGPMTVQMTALVYAWHSRHHVAHIMHLRKQEEW